MKQGELLFPKESTRKKRKKHHKSIIDRDMKNRCFICGKTGYTERHHIRGLIKRCSLYAQTERYIMIRKSEEC